MNASDSSYEEIKTVVVKVGSAVLLREDGSLDRGSFCRMVEMLAKLHKSGLRVVLVTSGAVAMGRKILGMDTRPRGDRSIPVLQALAALGQSHLIQLYESEFAHYGLHAAQILLTRDDFRDRKRYINARLAMEAIHRLGAVPVINENDTIATEEIKVGDNDQLAALVAILVSADRVVLLSDIDGLYTSNPRKDRDARRLPEVDVTDARLDEMVDDTHDLLRGYGTGGMRTKLVAARIAAQSGIATILAPGKRPDILDLVLRDTAEVGTIFRPSPDSDRLAARKAWLGVGAKVEGTITCDAGATNAVCARGKSLLPSGITSVTGSFEEGDAVDLLDPNGVVFARGLAVYDAESMGRIVGAQSSDIEGILGYKILDIVVHRDNLVLTNAS